MIYLNQFFLNLIKRIRKFYLSTSFYDKRISKISENDFVYKPSPHLLSSLIKYQKKIRIEDYSLNKIWKQPKITTKDFKELNNFNWFFSLDLKSSKKETQSVIKNWINFNSKYNSKSWDFDLTAKRIIAWLSCHNLTYDESDQEYRNIFKVMIQKQTNHLINELDNSDLIDDKLIGCASIILVGLCYNDEKKIFISWYKSSKKNF